MIPEIDAKALIAGDKQVLDAVRIAAEEIGFMTIVNTPFSRERMETLLRAYHRFFLLPESVFSDIQAESIPTTPGRDPTS